MSKTNKIILWLVVIIVVVGLIWLGYSEKDKTITEGEVIKIGVVNPMSGSVAFAGKQQKEGLDLALEEINEEGGINGKLIELIYEDGMCQPLEASKAVSKLIEQDEVIAVIGSYCYSSCLSMSPITERNEVILFASGMSPKIKEAGDFVFRNKPTFEIEAKATADFILKEGYKSSCVMYINNDYGVGGISSFRDSFVDIGGVINKEEAYNQDDTDFRTQLIKIKDSDCEALYLISHTNDYPIIARQFIELGLQKKVFTSAGFEDKSLENKPELEGIIYPFLFNINKDYKPLKIFLKKFNEVYNKNPDYQSSVAYDSLKIIVEAMKKCENPKDTICIKDELYKIKDYQGVAGLTSFNEFGDLVSREYEWKIYKNGKFVPYQPQ